VRFGALVHPVPCISSLFLGHWIHFQPFPGRRRRIGTTDQHFNHLTSSAISSWAWIFQQIPSLPLSQDDGRHGLLEPHRGRKLILRIRLCVDPSGENDQKGLVLAVVLPPALRQAAYCDTRWPLARWPSGGARVLNNLQKLCIKVPSTRPPGET
jgi:hypothetical protein